jgi:hypothetical protein
MSDTRDDEGLDTRIRELVARAVADAPRPPAIDPSDVSGSEPKPDPNHRAWWLGGGAAILAAAALITALLLVGDADDTVTTPATPPTVAPTPVPTIAPATTAPSTTAPTTTTTPPPPADTVPVLLSAGPDGVLERRGDATRSLTTDPMTIALDAGDGRIIVQRHSGNSGQEWTDADTIPLVLAADGSTSPLFGAATWDGAIVLHDIEVVDGHRLLLYSVQRPVVPQQPNEDLFVVDLDNEQRTRVARNIGGWEFGTGRLHLATTGLIVGAASAEANHAIAIYAVPGSRAEAAGLPTAGELGLESSYGDCTDCPNGFSVTPDGQTIVWVDRTAQLRLVGVTLGPPTGRPEVIVRLRRAGSVRDLDIGDSAAVMSFFSDPPVAARLVALDGSDDVNLDGTTATFGPLG